MYLFPKITSSNTSSSISNSHIWTKHIFPRLSRWIICPKWITTPACSNCPNNKIWMSNPSHNQRSHRWKNHSKSSISMTWATISSKATNPTKMKLTHLKSIINPKPNCARTEFYRAGSLSMMNSFCNTSHITRTIGRRLWPNLPRPITRRWPHSSLETISRTLMDTSTWISPTFPISRTWWSLSWSMKPDWAGAKLPREWILLIPPKLKIDTIHS